MGLENAPFVTSAGQGSGKARTCAVLLCIRVSERFYEKVIKVKADVAALLSFLVLCGFRHISAENFALGSLRSDDWQLARPTAPRFLSVFRVLSPPNASSLPCCIDPVVAGAAVKGARKGRSS